MDKDYIPGSNGEFDIWQENIVTVANTHISTWGLSVAAMAEWTLLTATATKKKLRWDAIWAVVKTKVFTHPQEVEMMEARRDYESGIRSNDADTSLRLFVARYIRFNIKVSNEQKAEMRLPVPAVVVTETSPSMAKAPEAELTGSVKTGQHLMHHSVVGVAGQKSKAKGEGVAFIQVFMVITDALPKVVPDIKTFSYAGVVQRGGFPFTFETAHVGKRAWYFARKMFKGKTDTYGPPSEFWDGVIM